MITHTLYGGIGNQLFQIGAVIALSLKTGHDFYFEVPAADSLIRTCALFAGLAPYCKESTECRALEDLLGVVVIHDPGDDHTDYGTLFDAVYRLDNHDAVFKLEGYFQSYRYLEGHFGALANNSNVLPPRRRCPPPPESPSISASETITICNILIPFSRAVITIVPWNK